MEIIEECDAEMMFARERHWIEHYLSIGADLTNHRPGDEHAHRVSTRHAAASFRDRLHRLRTDRSLTQEQLAQAIGLAGRGSISAPEMGVRPAWLAYGDGDPLTGQADPSICVVY